MTHFNLDEWENTRVEVAPPKRICIDCGSWQAVLRRHYVKDELELYCDGCETWLGIRFTATDLAPYTPRDLRCLEVRL